MIPNAISPFSVPLTYDVPSNKGFICFPHTKANPLGWGQPWKTEPSSADKNNPNWKSTPIFPGTIPDPTKDVVPQTNVLIYQSRKDWTWKRKVGPAVQGVGPVNWWGPDKKAAVPYNKHILSFWGPPTRYFADGLFSYGADPKHNEIYYEGRVAAIAPYPVVGACLQLVAGSSTRRWIVAVMWNGTSEVVFRREMKTLYTVAALTDATRIKLKKTYQAQSDPDGWRFMGELVGPDYTNAKPDSPWFFNELGTEALAIRRRELEFDSGGGAGSSKEIRNEVYKLTVETTNGNEGAAGKAVCSKEYAPDPYVYTEKVEKARPGIWVSPVDQYGETHQWREDYAKITITHTGRQPVAVDYVGNNAVIADLVLDVWLLLHQDWMLGVDPSNQLHKNTGQLQNNQPNSWTSEPRGHRAASWTDIRFDSILEWTVSGTKYKMYVEATTDTTRTGYDTGDEGDPADKTRYYTEHFRTYPRHLDLRKGLFMQARYMMFREFLTLGIQTFFTVDLEGYDEDSEVGFFPLMESTPPWVSTVLTQGWDDIIMNGWPTDFNYEWSKTSFVGKRPTDNDYGEKGYAYPSSFYSSSWTTIKDGWKGLELFRHIYFTQDSGFGQLPSGSRVMTLTVYDLARNDGSLRDLYATVDCDGSFPALTGGEQFYPVGVA